MLSALLKFFLAINITLITVTYLNKRSSLDLSDANNESISVIKNYYCSKQQKLCQPILIEAQAIPGNSLINLRWKLLYTLDPENKIEADIGEHGEADFYIIPTEPFSKNVVASGLK